MSNPTDVARLGHRYQVRLAHAVSARTLVASRIQSFAPSVRQQTEVYYELGTIDPTGDASESPEFQIRLEESVHNSELDLLLAGKAAIDTSWNLHDYISDGDLTAYLLARDNDGNVKGEMQFDQCVVSEITYRWQMGQSIMASYMLQGRLGRNFKPGSEPHGSWGTQDTTSPGGIRIKDARLFMGGTTSGYRLYRLQSFTMKHTFPTTPVREAGSRALVGWVVEPPRTTLDIDLMAADQQPDDVFYTNFSTYYDYVNPLVLTDNAIRIYDPAAAEASSVIRSWKMEKLKPTNTEPISAQVRGVATKRYSFVLNKATTSNSGGVLFYDGDLA